ncbi:MAG: hypothetical protein BA865_05840 [Desulfobacterales bacterium S5133MH4]|nr:MAG: hypothetical protein BA865_05840 [Desulfobacterales bacterium S5133MH4]
MPLRELATVILMILVHFVQKVVFVYSDGTKVSSEMRSFYNQHAETFDFLTEDLRKQVGLVCE